MLGQIARRDVEVPHEVARGKLFEGRLALLRKLTFGAVWYNVDMYHVGALGRVVDDWRPHGDGRFVKILEELGELKSETWFRAG